jgi:glutathione peroxidase
LIEVDEQVSFLATESSAGLNSEFYVNRIGMDTFAHFYLRNKMASFYDFKIKALDGSELDLSELRGKKVLLVNTASKCGYTFHYEGLEKLYQKYRDSGFVVLGIPSNDFGGQEPGDDSQIAQFCEVNYGVTFPMASRMKITGEDMHPLFRWLQFEKENGFADFPVTWNFQKFCIDEDGWIEKVIAPSVEPESELIVEWITQPKLF